MKIENYAFYACNSLEYISLPSTVTEIGLEAFIGCGRLREVVLSDRLKKVGQFAFQSCKSLQSITIPSTVTEIDRYAFSFCPNLRELVLSEGLQKIGDNAFHGCTSIERITVPSTVTVIDKNAFIKCSNLREVVCIEGLPAIEHNTFDGCRLLKRIAFPNLSSRLEAIIQAGQLNAQDKIQQYITQGDIEWERGSILYIPADATRSSYIWKELKQRVDQIVRWIKYYEMKEATTIFELALWKAKMDQAKDDINEQGRDAYRVEVPGPVKDTILQYLING